jgi:hypothetical protein
LLETGNKQQCIDCACAPSALSNFSTAVVINSNQDLKCQTATVNVALAFLSAGKHKNPQTKI